MTNIPRRPFYAEYAWAYDLLIDRPVVKECDAIAGWLVDRGAVPGAHLLDAGCGTGRYSAELARRGYLVQGVDQMPELIDAARAAVSDRRLSVSFRVGDILALPSAAEFDAVLCRGVLNDLVEADARRRVFGSFASALRPGGVLILDVREWEATHERKRREPIFRKRVATNRGTLTFASDTEIDTENHQLIVSERHVLVDDRGEHASDYRFVMRCWTRGELETALGRSGFGAIAYHGAYDRSVDAGATDRLVAISQLSR